MMGACGIRMRKKERADTTRASVEKEMAMPRMAGSARIMKLILLDTTRIPGQPSTTMRGTVGKIIPSPGPRLRQKA